MPLRPRSLPLWAASTFALAILVWAAVPAQKTSMNLAADLPPGALMTLESSDFNTLLNSWTQSPEQKAWLNSASYSAFANSRLFSRLADAQSGFASAAKTAVDGSFLHEVAGKESIFAWYDIGNLEFLYITHLPHDEIGKIALLQQRSSFARRESAGTPFYLRTDTASAEATVTDNEAPAQVGDLDQPRTVAFAVRGDWLLFATREDLIANALQLMAAQDTGNAAADSQANAGWFSAAAAVAPEQHGDLHMLLDLQSLTKTPQFRTYWIQRNVTDTRQYRAAVVDLYREPGRFREERVLLPMGQPASPDEADLGALQALVPEHVGVYRATAQPTPDLTLGTLEQKLLNSTPVPIRDSNQAPAPEQDVPLSGSAHDFDTRIDAPPPVLETPDEALAPLRHVLDSAGVQSMLTLDRSEPLAPDTPFVFLHSAVVLRAASSWSADTLSQALSTELGARLTTSSLGLTWQHVSSPNGNYLRLGGAQPLALLVDGQLAILSNDPGMFDDISARRSHPATAASALLIAGMNPGGERTNFRRLTAQLAQSSAPPQGVQPNNSVQLFRDNLPSLAESFSSLTSERIVVRRDGPLVRQSVMYQWANSPITRTQQNR